MLPTRIPVATGLFIAALSAMSATQGPPAPAARTGTGIISGTVIDAVTSRPLDRATVRLQPSNASARTDDDGRFTFSGLQAGEFRLMATLGGYAMGWFGARAPLAGEQPFDLAAGEKVSGLAIRLWANATVTGTVTNAAQAPVVGATVVAARVDVSGGRETFGGFGHTTSTDNRGAYRFTDLEPGDFAIVLRSPTNIAPTERGYSTSGYPTLFYPDATSTLGASVLTLGGGETRNDIDFHITRRPLFVIRGTIPGSPGPHELTLLPAEPGRTPNAVDARKTLADAQGRFTFAGVVAGQYTIEVAEVPNERAPDGTARMMFFQRAGAISMVNAGPSNTLPIAPAPSTPTLWASVPVTVIDRNINDVEIVLTPAARIDGTVVFDGTASPPDDKALAATPVMVLATDGRELGMLPGSGIDATGHFQTVGVPPGSYEVSIFSSLFQGWSLASVTAGGWEMTGVPLDVGTADVQATFTFTDRPGRLSGLVRDADGKPAADATIYLFSTDRRTWTDGAPIVRTARAIRPLRNGRYQAAPPPGTYYVAAVEAAARNDWQRTEVLEALAKSASTVTIVLGRTATVDLTVPRGR